MSRRLIIRPEAEAELAEAYRWYETHRPGLGEDFLLCVDARLASIQRNPALYPTVHKKVRRALVRRFPYGVFYVSERDTIAVIAIMHLGRSPERWRRRADQAPSEPT